MPACSVLAIVRRYVINGGHLRSTPGSRPYTGSNMKMTREVLEYIMDQRVLNRWRHLTLEERTVQIHKLFGVKMTGQRLGKYPSDILHLWQQ